MEKVAKSDLPAVAKKILHMIPPQEGRVGRAALVTLNGDLGAGKTTLVQALARELGVEGAVQSPTYVLMKSYELSGHEFKRLVHIDAYRLIDAVEFAALNPSSFLLDEDALVCVEWPERIEGALPKPDVSVLLSSQDAEAEERYIELA